MSRVDIYRLETGRTYQIIRSRKDTDLLDYVHDSSGTSRTYLLARPSIFAQRRPPKLDCWDDLIDYEPPRGEKAPLKWMVLAHGDDGIALGLNGPLSKPERDDLLNSVELVSVQRAQARASKDDTGSRLAGTAFAVLVSLAVVVTLVIILVGLSGFFASRDGVEGEATGQQYEVQPPPTPVPGGAPPTPVPVEPVQWQNPRPGP